ncbi:MAG: 16S rRNA pseudouridine(516) synthase [Oscillospiraceae bacterium]|nr:16S rRNA pseudouridine(516) synthase [Oscillospiraceae bacterium]
MKEERLDKLLAAQGPWSRRDIKDFVRRGAVTVNGKNVRTSDIKITTDDEVIVFGKPIALKKHIYLMLNKPIGVVSASRGDDCPTVVDLVPPELKRKGLFPAGRLDKDTTGFVLITDDGAFAHDILSPKRHIPKTYIATLDGILTQEVVDAFAGGIPLKNEDQCLPAQLTILDDHTAQVVLHEGMYHQIKRMFAACGLHVEALHRKAMGALELDKNLAEGQCRELTAEELLLVQDRDGLK